MVIAFKATGFDSRQGPGLVHQLSGFFTRAAPFTYSPPSAAPFGAGATRKTFPAAKSVT